MFLEHINLRLKGLSIPENILVLDTIEEIATFMCYNPVTNKLCGYLCYDYTASKEKRNDEKGRYYIMSKNPVYWTLKPLEYTRPVYLVEGVWDAVALIAAGYQAIAVLSNDPKHLNQTLKLLPTKTIAVCDNDKAGLKLAYYADTHVVCSSKDPGDMTLEEIRELLG